MRNKEKKAKPEKNGKHEKNWKDSIATVDDIQDFLMDRILLRYNVITGRVEYRIPSSYEHDSTDWMPITDRVINSLWAEMSAKKTVRVVDMYRVIGLCARLPPLPLLPQ